MKILLADDNPEVRSALRLLLEQEPVLAVVTEVADTQSLLAHLSESCPMVVLLDWELPGLHNGDFLMMVRLRCPEMKVIALSSKFEARQEALAASVDAFISKAEPSEQILSTLCSFIPDQKNE
ncbi:MAG: response regulator transcription factor [Anaerolineales bacterium]|nr:response regulator transcription factor [Anaerolineales bacterium]